MQETKILLIVPPLIPIEEIKRTNSTTSQWATNCSIPMGLLSIAAYVCEHSNAKFTLLDLNVEIAKSAQEFEKVTWVEFLQRRMFQMMDVNEVPQIVAISAIFNSNAGYLQSISAVAKATWPGVLTLAGGGLPTNMYSQVLGMAPDLDAVAIGEGEKPLLNLVAAEDRLHYLASGSGWMTRERVRTGSPATMDLVQNLDDIPFFRYDLIEFEEYQHANRYHGEKSGSSVTVSIMTSRGCPYLCNFCASHSVHGRKLRFHSPERILEDIRKLKKMYGVNVVLIEDDNFIADKKYALNILEEISREGITIEFPNGLSISHHDEEIVDALQAAGLKMATLAVESGNERVLKEIINKPYKDLTKVREVVALYRKKDIFVRAFFIIGFPGETMEEIFESVNFMKNAGFNWVAVMIASPVAGSDLYSQCKDEGLLLSDNLDDFHYGKCNIKLPHSTPNEIENLRYMINLEVNFIDNFDLKNGRPDSALIAFEDVINRVPGHAFAYYFASQCCRLLEERALEDKYMQCYKEIVNSSEEWSKYARAFNLPVQL